MAETFASRASSPMPFGCRSHGAAPQSIGFVYQFHHLLPEFSALENIVLPQMIAGVAKSAPRKRGMELLERVALAPAPATGRPGCPVASSSGSPSPGLWRTVPSC